MTPKIRSGPLEEDYNDDWKLRTSDGAHLKFRSEKSSAVPIPPCFFLGSIRGNLPGLVVATKMWARAPETHSTLPLKMDGW